MFALVKTYGLVLTLLATLIVIPAHALITVTQMQSYTITDPTGSTGVTFNDLSSSVGILQSVEIILGNVAFTEGGTVQDTYTSGPSRNYTATLYGQYNVYDGVNSVYTSLITGPPNSTTLAPGAFYTIPTNSATAIGTSATFTDAPTLALYQSMGASTITLDMLSDDYATVTGGNNSTVVSSTGSGVLTLIYSYTPVPEPSQTAVWILGLGLCLMVGHKLVRRLSLI